VYICMATFKHMYGYIFTYRYINIVPIWRCLCAQTIELCTILLVGNKALAPCMCSVHTYTHRPQQLRTDHTDMCVCANAIYMPIHVYVNMYQGQFTRQCVYTCKHTSIYIHTNTTHATWSTTHVPPPPAPPARPPHVHVCVCTCM
jgi:hypothetical protein